MDPVVHFELPVNDLARAKAFYGGVFGWHLMEHPMPDGSVYVGAVTTPVDEQSRMPLKPGAINGGVMVRNDRIKSPVFAISVPSIDDRVRQVEAAGGKLVQAKVDLQIGFYAYVSDPDGNIVGLWEDAKK